MNANIIAEIVTQPTAEPLTLLEAKKQLEIAPSDTTHDQQLSSLIQEAREQWENDTGMATTIRSLVIKTQSVYDGFRIPVTPVYSITQMSYYNTANASTVWSSSNYQLHSGKYIRLASGVSVPATYARWDAWTISFSAGYSIDGISVPARAKRAMLLLVGHYFENRDMLISDGVSGMRAYEALVSRFMRGNYP